MARNPNPFYWTYGIPIFNMAHRFVYMNDLKENLDNNSPIVQYRKLQLYNETVEAAQASAAEIAVENLTYTKSALDFLKNAAYSERNKEIMILKDYKEQLQKDFSGTDIDKIISKLNEDILDNPREIINFYTELTKYLNTIRQSYLKYQQRLLTFQRHFKKEMDELPKDDYRFRTPGDIESLLNNVIGIAIKSQEQKMPSYASKLRQATIRYLEKTGLLARLLTEEDIAAAFATALIDIEEYMQQQLEKRGLNDLVDLSDDFDEIIEEYLNAEEEQQSHFQQVINNNEEELNYILDAAKNILHIELIGKQSIEGRKKTVTSRTKRLGKENSLHRYLTGKYKNNPAITNLQLLNFSLGAETSQHGNIFELIRIVQNGKSIKICGPSGADLLHLGSFHFDILPADIQAQVMPLLKEIGDILTKHTQEKRQDRFDDKIEEEKIMNEKIQEVLKLIDMKILELDQSNSIKNLFVYHESLKLYKTVEVGKKTGFHGRELVILSYLDKIYSADGIAGLILPPRNVLNFLAFNLSSLAVGGEIKGVLEKYFSIFAGLLMFDDIRSIAYDAMLQLEKKELGITKQIHLYDLNGLYVPASMILSFTYEGMKHITEDIANNYAARATISTSKADTIIQNYLDTRPKPLKKQWSEVAENVISNTNVSITIFLAFNNFLQALGVDIE